MAVKFHKLHSSGNDFLIIVGQENRDLNNFVNSEFISSLCDRHCGVGADGVFFVFENGVVKHFDPDGSESFCVNGSLCLAFFGEKTGYIKNFFHLNGVRINVEKVSKDEAAISFKIGKTKGILLNVKGMIGTYIDIGNPHFFVEDIIPDVSVAKKLRNSPEFKKGANISFFKKIKDNTFEIATYERGVEGFTLACGSACAAFVFAFNTERAMFYPPSKIPVFVEKKGNIVYVRGEVSYVAEGFFYI